jgi:ribosomal protein S18 acetylase RimI-like enzyme
MPDWTIEPLTSADDLDGVLAVEHAAFTNPWTREMYRRNRMPACRSSCWRDRSGQVIGFCSFWRIYDELHISNLAVLPDWRSRGVGAALLTPCSRARPPVRCGSARGSSLGMQAQRL